MVVLWICLVIGHAWGHGKVDGIMNFAKEQHISHQNLVTSEF